MPWKETCPLEERKRFIEDWLAGGSANIAALCRLYQISRRTGYKWLERFREGGLAALEDRSHAARRQPRRIPEAIEQQLIQARRLHPSWGPKKLRAWLERREPQTSWPAASTIGEALKRAGLVRPQSRPRRLSEAALSPLQEPVRANEVWTIDYKGQFRTGDGVLCYPLTVVDAYSRYLLDCAAQSGAAVSRTRLAAADAQRQRYAVRLDGGGAAESLERVVAQTRDRGRADRTGQAATERQA